MKVPFINFGKSYAGMREEILAEIDRVLSSGDLILRKDVETFEENLAHFIGTRFSVGVNSGTDALYLSLKALGIREGDEVITSSHTFVATIQVIELCGAKPVLVDLGEDWEKYRTDKTAAIIPVHIAGEITNWKSQYIPIIEDACQALGAIKNPNSFSQCWSFYPAKILGCYGDGGAITTNDEEMRDELVFLRNHYKPTYSKWGVNSRLDNLQAAILNVKLQYLPGFLERRKEIAEIYLKELTDIPGLLLPKNDMTRVWQDFIVQTRERDELYEFLKGKGVETMKNEYPMPIFKGHNSLEYESQTLRIPCNETLTYEEVEYVISCIKNFFL